jgi:uncharacterized protein (DUF1778 family)
MKEVSHMASTTISIRLDEREKALIADYAGIFGQSLSEFMRQAAIERMEDELDLEIAIKAKAEYDADPISYPAEEIEAKYL